MKILAILILPIFLLADAKAQAVTGSEIVAKHAITLNAPVGEPTQFMPSGPLLGNGDVGVMQSGPAEQLIYYIGKNDFWSIKYQSPIAVGQLRILTPALQGAKFQTVSDMRLAEIRGDYVNGDAAMTSRFWVDGKVKKFEGSRLTGMYRRDAYESTERTQTSGKSQHLASGISWHDISKKYSHSLYLLPVADSISHAACSGVGDRCLPRAAHGTV